MNCMKCGRETLAEQVFCEDCLLNMEKYPVKPGTAVHLPRRREAAPNRKNAKRRTVSPEEQVKHLRKLVLHLTIGLILSLAAVAAMVYPTFAYLMETRYAPGQNYSVISTTAPTTEAADATLPVF